MGFAAFAEHFPKIGRDECRVVILLDGGESIPPGSYAFLEYFCVDKACDCRRVQFIVTSEQTGEPVASIAFGFDRDEPLAGPFLDFLNPQSEYAYEILQLAKQIVLSDENYVARVEKHYQMLRSRLCGKTFVAGFSAPLAEVQERIASRKASKQLLRRFHQRNKK